MSAENRENGVDAQVVKLNGEFDHHNGVNNGYAENREHKHKSSSKDKHRDKDRDHKSSSSRSKDSDKHKHSASSSGKDKHRDKDRDKDRHKSSLHKSSSRDKDREREKDKERSKDKDKERSKKEEGDGDKEKSRDKERSKSHKSSSSRDKDHKSSSSSSKDKTSSSSSKDKHRDKDRHHSSSKDKHRDKDRHRDKDKSRSKEEHTFEPPKHVKSVFDAPRNDYDQSCTGFDAKQSYATEMKVEHNNFNISQASSCDYSMSQFRSDEPNFVVKAENEYDSTFNVEEEEVDVETSVKHEPMDAESDSGDDEEDIPLAQRKTTAPVPMDEDSDYDVPLAARKKVVKSEKKDKKKKKREIKDEDDDDYDEKPRKKKIKKEKTVVKNETSPTKKKKKADEEPEDVWRWWEEEKKPDGVKWNFLEHKGPVFAPPYDPLPNHVRFYYDGKEMKLSEETEEVATFYAKMLNHDYVTKKVFNDNFFKDWRKSMTSKEKEKIKDLSKCNFQEMHAFFNAESEKRKNATKEEKLAIKEQNEQQVKEYGFCIIDGHKEKIGNFKLEPPGLFRGRGEHPKMGMIKRRIAPGDVSINCAKDSKIPQPPKGTKWKDVRHDNSVTWLASWIENVQGQVKYIMLNPSSKLKGEKDHIKYETARKLDKSIEKIRATYRDEWKSKEMRVRQRAVALYFIDKLALRAGNEKDEDQADTVGCCSLRVEHVSLKKELNGKENVVVFDFLGKDSIRYYNEVEVEKRVFKNLELFMENKKEGDDLFDRLNTQVLNEHLKELMEGLTAKVFRTYNASITLQNQLDLLTDPNSTVPEKLLAYNRANRAVAVLCNHQRSVPKSHAKSMENLKEKIRAKRELIDDCEAEYHDLKKAAKRGSAKEKIMADKKEKQLERLKEQLQKLELQETDRDENKTIALGTSKLNYLDPRISVAWCKKYGVPIEKIFNKTQRDKFRWAIHMADENYRF